MTAHIVRAPSTQIPASWGVSPAGAARVQREEWSCRLSP